MPKPTKSSKAASGEYARLIALYKAAGVDEIKLAVNDRLICKVAEVFGVLEDIKHLPTILFDKRNPNRQIETAAGRMRVKLLAQYSSSMQRLNKELLGVIEPADDDGLSEFSGE